MGAVKPAAPDATADAEPAHVCPVCTLPHCTPEELAARETAQREARKAALVRICAGRPFAGDLPDGAGLDDAALAAAAAELETLR